ncbi:MAG: hypothetical protein WKF88_10960 [Ferruginibacter sp.]
MGEIIYNGFQVLLTSLYFINLFLFLKVRKNKNIEGLLQTFYLYPLVGALVSMLFWLRHFDLFPKDIFRIINQVSVLFHFSFLSFFIYKKVDRSKIYRFIAIVFFIIIIPFLYNDMFKGTFVSFAIANGFLFILCCFYFYNLFSSPPVLNLLQEPAFWICSGILLGSGLLIPFNAFNRQFLNLILNREIFYLLGVLAMLGYIVLHFFLIKSFLCTRQ